MVLWLALSVAWADSAEKCTAIGLSDITSVKGPAVIVLGERHGTEPDLRRAATIVKQLHAKGSVTVALEAVHEKYQKVLDDYAHGVIAAADLPTQLDWEKSWGFAYKPYAPLVTLGTQPDYKVVAAGLDLGEAPTSADFPVPSGYLSILRDSMAGHDVAPEMQDTFVKAMAYRDYEIARDAVKGWDGMGWLVILTGRGHVEGGKGVAFQAGLLTKAKVESFVLDWGVDPPCYPGDKVWKRGTFEPSK